MAVLVITAHTLTIDHTRTSIITSVIAMGSEMGVVIDTAIIAVTVTSTTTDAIIVETDTITKNVVRFIVVLFYLRSRVCIIVVISTVVCWYTPFSAMIRTSSTMIRISS